MPTAAHTMSTAARAFTARAVTSDPPAGLSPSRSAGGGAPRAWPVRPRTCSCQRFLDLRQVVLPVRGPVQPEWFSLRLDTGKEIGIEGVDFGIHRRGRIDHQPLHFGGNHGVEKRPRGIVRD